MFQTSSGQFYWSNDDQLMLQDQFTIKMLMRVAAIMFLLLIRLWFPKSKSISDNLDRRYGQSTLKRIRKFEKPGYRLRKEAQLDV